MVCQHGVVRRHVEDVECGVWCGVVCMGCGVDYTWWDYTWSVDCGVPDIVYLYRIFKPLGRASSNAPRGSIKYQLIY